MRRQLLAGFVAILPLFVGLSSCVGSEKSEGLNKVDDLLTRVEQVQIEALVAREKASAAFDALGAIVAPDFQGDPMLVYGDLVKKIDESKAQAKKLEMSVEPMKRTSDIVFQSWTTDLEKFGNTNLRQQSQSRLAETRSRYSAVHDAAVAALVSINAFNSDLGDQALFLEHDFNSTAVTVIAAEIPALTSQARDLGRRLNACVSASKDYIACSALRGQLEEPAAPAAPASKAAAAAPARRMPNPMAEPGTEPQVAGTESGANTSTPPARRRPRAGANPIETPEAAPNAAAPVEPAAPVAPNAQPLPNPQAAPTQPVSQGSTQPTSQPGKPLPVLGPLPPKPETDLNQQPKPAPVQPAAGGNL